MNVTYESTPEGLVFDPPYPYATSPLEILQWRAGLLSFAAGYNVTVEVAETAANGDPIDPPGFRVSLKLPSEVSVTGWSGDHHPRRRSPYCAHTR